MPDSRDNSLKGVWNYIVYLIEPEVLGRARVPGRAPQESLDPLDAFGDHGVRSRFPVAALTLLGGGDR